MTAYNALTGRRTISPVDRYSRQKCSCCGNRATKLLMADGCAMGKGCDLFALRWVKDARNAIASIYRLKQMEGQG